MDYSYGVRILRGVLTIFDFEYFLFDLNKQKTDYKNHK